MQNYYIAIMAGGVGSRFWPSSREHKPKQFLDMLGIGKSLIQMTYDRFADSIPAKNMYCVTNAAYSRLVHSELPEMPVENILGEPSRNNTAPCILYTTLKIYKDNPDAIIGFVPSDHLILKEREYMRLCLQAFDFAATNEAIVTLGIQPSRPDTGYGYIHFEKNENAACKRVIRFYEKPDAEKAQTFLESGDYLWNAGMFFVKAKTLLTAYKEFATDMYSLLSPMLAWPTEQQNEFLKQSYPATQNISIDYAIMEKSSDVYTIPADIGWSDLGTWASLHHEMEKDKNGNAIIAQHLLLENVKNSIIKNQTEKVVILRDLSDLIVIVEDDVVLIYPKDKEQDIKQLRERISNSHYKIV